MSTATEQVEQIGDTAQPAAQPSDPPITWTHSIPDRASYFEAGPWTAIISDPIETPPSIRLAGRYIVRGFLRHEGGRSLSKDFGGNTEKEATLEAARWAESSVYMWLRALQGTVGSSPLSVLTHLPPDSQQTLIGTAFDSLRVSVARGHLPPNTPVGIDAMQPKAQPIPREGKRKRKRRKRMRKKG